MNNEILKKYGMSFLIKANGNKIISNTASSYIASYISTYDDIEILEGYIADVELCLNGQYPLIDDPSRSTDIQFARLYPDGLYFDGETKMPLNDLKELLTSWMEFLKS